MGLGTPPQHDHSSPISPPKRTQPREMVSHSFHFVSDFTLINPPGSQKPLTNFTGKTQGDSEATDQSWSCTAPVPAPADLCCSGAASVSASLCG